MISRIKEDLQPKKSAVLVIDMQNDFCHRQGHFGKQKLNLLHVREKVLFLKSEPIRDQNHFVIYEANIFQSGHSL